MNLRWHGDFRSHRSVTGGHRITSGRMTPDRSSNPRPIPAHGSAPGPAAQVKKNQCLTFEAIGGRRLSGPRPPLFERILIHASSSGWIGVALPGQTGQARLEDASVGDPNWRGHEIARY